MKKLLFLVICSIVIAGCGGKTAEEKVKAQVANVYALTADERSMAATNAKAYFERQWINAGNERGQFTNCRPSDSNFNGLVSCFGMMPLPGGGYREMKMYCGYRPEMVGCSDEDTVK